MATLIALAPQEERSIDIPARPRWVATGLLLERVARYDLHADGTWCDWKEAHGPSGHPGKAWKYRLFAWVKRYRGAPWFALVGTIDRDRRSRFLIGDGLVLSPRRNGELICWANDVSVMYWNNSGAVRLTVKRLD